jgi:hypothetical protein
MIKGDFLQKRSYGGFPEPMAIIFLLKGIVIGFSIAAPVGPIGVLCIRRTLSNGWASGSISGLGAATADAIYGSIAGFGLTFISNFMVSQEVWLRLVGGVFLCSLGTKIFLSKASELTGAAKKAGLLGIMRPRFSDPDKSFDHYFFAAVFAGLGLGTSPETTCLPVSCFRRFLWISLVVVCRAAALGSSD